MFHSGSDRTSVEQISLTLTNRSAAGFVCHGTASRHLLRKTSVPRLARCGLDHPTRRCCRGCDPAELVEEIQDDDEPAVLRTFFRLRDREPLAVRMQVEHPGYAGPCSARLCSAAASGTVGECSVIGACGSRCTSMTSQIYRRKPGCHRPVSRLHSVVRSSV